MGKIECGENHYAEPHNCARKTGNIHNRKEEQKINHHEGHEEHEKNEGVIMEFEKLSNKVLGLIIEVHKNLGPGLLENTYKQCLAYELCSAGISFEMEVSLPVNYKSVNISCAYRIDLIIDDQLIIELKNVEKLLPVHEAQILTYMRLSKINIGLLINFNEKYLKNGIKRYVI